MAKTNNKKHYKNKTKKTLAWVIAMGRDRVKDAPHAAETSK